MVHILEVGAFFPSQLVPLRLVNRALCDAASDPSLYRTIFAISAAVLETLPMFMTSSARRLNMHPIVEELDLGDVSRLLPNLTRLDCRFTRLTCGHLVEGADLVPLRELSMTADNEQGTDYLSQLTKLECLEIAELDHLPPIASLPALTRLSVPNCEADTGELMSLLATAPCAETFVALHLEVLVDATVSPGWWVPLSDLSSLRELSLDGGAKSHLSLEDERALADVLGGLPALVVLDVGFSKAVILALLHRGFPPNLKVLGMGLVCELEVFLAALPRGLLALQLRSRGKLSVADVRTLLSRCPKLRAMDLSCDDEAVAYLVGGGLADRTLVLNASMLRPASDALTAAGHTVNELRVGVHWRIGGAVVCDGKAMAV